MVSEDAVQPAPLAKADGPLVDVKLPDTWARPWAPPNSAANSATLAAPCWSPRSPAATTLTGGFAALAALTAALILPQAHHAGTPTLPDAVTGYRSCVPRLRLSPDRLGAAQSGAEQEPPLGGGGSGGHRAGDHAQDQAADGVDREGAPGEEPVEDPSTLHYGSDVGRAPAAATTLYVCGSTVS